MTPAETLALELHGPAATPAAPSIPEVENATGLVALALKEKVPVEVLERIVALQERVAERDARGAYFQALASFQKECPVIHKSKTAAIATRSGGAYNYTYAPLEEITKTIRPILERHGLSYGWTTNIAAVGMLNVTCILRHIDGHQERSDFPVPTETAAAMSGAQKNGAALTYGRRQSLVAVLGLTTSDDVDGGNGPEDDDEDIYITVDQMDQLSHRIDEVGADFPRFLAFMGIGSLKEMKKVDFARAERALAQKKKPS